MKTTNLRRQILCLFLQTSICASLCAQAPPLSVNKDLGGSADDELRIGIQTTNGGYLFGGSSNSPVSGTQTQRGRGGYDYWIIKANASGGRQWIKRFGGGSDDKLSCMQQTADGGYILGGSSESKAGGDKSETTRGSFDYWVVKITPGGIKQWDKRFGGGSADFMTCVKQTADGGYILGGYSWSKLNGDKSQATRGKADYWVVKIDANGNKQWDKRFGGSDYDDMTCIQLTTDGGYILGGYSYYGISGDKTQPGQGNGDYWIVKIDGSGNKLWDKRFGGDDYEHMYAIQVTNDGGYILGGDSRSKIAGDKTENSRGKYDFWVVKVDANGIKQWDHRYGGKGFESLNSLEKTSDGGYILGGESQSDAVGDKTQNSQGGTDFWIVKINSSGTLQWDADYGAASEDFLFSAQQTTDGGYLLNGCSESNIGGDKTENTYGGYDYWILKLTPSGALKSSVTAKAAAFDNNKFTLSPNPASGIVYIKGDNLKTVQVFNSAGVNVVTKNLSGSVNAQTIDVSSLSKGLYIVNMTDVKGNVQTEKLIVQ